MLRTIASKPASWLGWMSIKKKAGASTGSRSLDFAPEIALDERDRHQHGQADPERKNDLRGRRAGSVEVGERQPQYRPLGRASLLAASDDRRARPPE